MDVLLIVGAIASIYVAGLLAERRGRSVKRWAWIAALVGPLAFVVLLLPERKNGDQV
jgi:hypothetical protein